MRLAMASKKPREEERRRQELNPVVAPASRGEARATRPREARAREGAAVEKLC